MIVMVWTKCIICQKVTRDSLKCPMNSASGTHDEEKEIYESFLKNDEELCTFNALPVQLLFSSDISADILAENVAQRMSFDI